MHSRRPIWGLSYFMNSVGWFGHFPHRLSVGLSVGLLRAAAGLGLPARAFLNLEIRGLLPPAPCGLIPNTGRAVVRNALQPFPRAYRETYSPHERPPAQRQTANPATLPPNLRADCLAADSPPEPTTPTQGRQPKGRRPTPRLYPQAPGRLPTANSPPDETSSPTQGRQPKGRRPTPSLAPSTGQIAYRQTALPVRPTPRPKAASPKADGQPRTFPQAPGRLPTGNQPSD